MNYKQQFGLLIYYQEKSKVINEFSNFKGPSTPNENECESEKGSKNKHNRSKKNFKHQMKFSPSLSINLN